VSEPRPLSTSLAELFQLEPAGEDAFRAQLPGFGGITLGCATRAAASTTELSLHSLHVYFLRAVPTDRPALFRVERVRDGRRFAHRRVEVRDGDKLCCELVASFAAPGGGVEYQEAFEGTAPPTPEGLPSEEEIAREEGWLANKPGPIGGALEWRFIGGAPWRPAGSDGTSRYQGWVRPRAPLPGERALRAATLAFLADMHSHMPVARRLGAHFEPIGYTSLDQTLWVHRDEPWTDWRLLTSVSDVAHAGRAFTRRTLHARDGRLLASMAQEQLVPFGADGPAGG
jgi:acyl-CoA thioesterase-2